MHVPEPSEILRDAVRRALEEDGSGARRFEAEKGLKKWSLRGLLDPENPHIPSVDRAAEICQAIDLELYVGPSRRADDLARVAMALRLPTTASLPELLDAIGDLRGSSDVAAEIKDAAEDLQRTIARIEVATRRLLSGRR